MFWGFKRLLHLHYLYDHDGELAKMAGMYFGKHAAPQILKNLLQGYLEGTYPGLLDDPESPLYDEYRDTGDEKPIIAIRIWFNF